MTRAALHRVALLVGPFVVGGVLVGTTQGQLPDAVIDVPTTRDASSVKGTASISVNTHYLGVLTSALPASVRAQIDSLVPEGTGLLVTQIVLDSPAASAGLQRYDVLLAVGRAKVAVPGDVDEAVAAVPVGDEVTLRVVRGGRPTTLTVRVAARPEVAATVARGEADLARAAMSYSRTQAPRAPERRDTMPLADGPIGDRSILLTSKIGKPFEIVVHEGEDRWAWFADGAEAKLPEDLPVARATDAKRLLASAAVARAKGTFRFRVQPRANEDARSVVLLLQQPGSEDEYRVFEIERTLTVADGDTLPVDRLLETVALKSEFEHLSPAVREKLTSALERFRVPPVQVRVREPQ